MLSAVLEEKGIFEEAQKLRRDTMDQVRSIMKEDVEVGDIDEAFFDQFVLFCHR